MKRKILRGFGIVVVVSLFMSLIITAMLRNSFVQTYLARVVAIHLSEYLHTHVKIEKLRATAFLTLTAEGIEINDLRDEPMIQLEQLYASADLFQAMKSGLAVNKLQLDSARVFLRRYAGDDDLNIVELLAKFQTMNSLEDTLSAKVPLKLSVEELSLSNSRFVYQIQDRISPPGFGMDYNDLDVQDIDVYLRNALIVGDSIAAEIEHINAYEKCGIQLNNLQGKARVYNQGMVLTDALLETTNSNLQLNLDFTYQGWRSYLDFVSDVSMHAEIKTGGELNTLDISYFAPAMEDMDNLLQLSGTISGPVRNLRARNLKIGLGNDTRFLGNVQMTGLPNIYETFISFRVRNFVSSISDIQRFSLPGGGVLDEPPELLKSFGNIQIRGNFTGFYNDFVSNATFTTSIGQLVTDIQFSNNPKRNIIEYRGDFQARRFDLGRFVQKQDYFGSVDFDLRVKGEGLNLEELNADVEGKIHTFQFKQRQLADIGINGLFQERQFNGDISINDRLIQADFGGKINFDTLVPVFNFDLKLKHTHLAKLGLLQIDTSAVLASNIRLNFTGKTLDDIRGSIRLDSTQLSYIGASYFMESLQLQTGSDNFNNRTITLNSDYVDGDVKGQFLLRTINASFQAFLGNYLPNVFKPNEEQQLATNEQMDWDIRFKDLSDILPLFQKPIDVAKNGHWQGEYSAGDKQFSSSFLLDRASYQGIIFDSLYLDVHSSEPGLSTKLSVSSLIFKEKTKQDTLGLSIDNLVLSSLMHNDSIHFLVDWNNNFKALKNFASIDGDVRFSEMPEINLKLNKADIVINDTSWYIHPENTFKLVNNKLLFDKVGFYSGSQKIEVAGAIDQESEQALKLSFNHFYLSNFDILLNYKGVDLNGQIDGDIQFVNLSKSYDFLADLKVLNLMVNNEHIGNATINSKRNTDKSIFVNAEIVKLLENNQVKKPLVFKGYFLPENSANSLDFNLVLNELPVQVVSPFLYSFVDEFSGTASGNVRINGTPAEPGLQGSVKLNEVGFRIIYLNTHYTLSADAVIDNRFIDLRNADLRDDFNNKAQLYGGLFHNHLKDFGVDLSIWPNNFMGLNTRKGMNSLFYGTAFASGTVDINGMFDAVALNMNLTANRNSAVVIPINLTADVSDIEYINFINPVDTLPEKQQERKQIKELSNFSLNMDLSLTPDARVEIILPEELGNIQGEGYGDLNLNLNRAGNFTMAGDYQVNKGSFLFTVKNVYKKRFDLEDGGTISWTGDPYAGELNMKAIYHVKTSLNTLGMSQDTSFRTRVPVDCIIGLKDEILNPQVKFSFAFPNSSEEVKQTVYSQIDTTNQAEMSQQMLSLLVLNSFSFSSATGNENFASGVGGSSLQLVANQLSNWLSQISKDVDVGIKYRPGGAITNEEVEVALSTQLFDERVSIDGNFGYQNLNNVPSTNTSNIVGDINVEVKMTKDGRFRMKAFNRTNAIDMDNIAPYTQGVGVFYRKEFNTFKDLFKRKKKKKKSEDNTEESKKEEPLPDDQSGANTANNSTSPKEANARK